ncbi:MAG: hypothetical protein M1835_004870 [Candelina submexicana]|nr:MAG: hypothetical protein M1835_004870 [Candelina submexicana]
MPGPSNTLLIEGTFEELADELAVYIDGIKNAQNEGSGAVQAEITPLLEKGEKDNALRRLVVGSATLNSAPEKEFIAAYNLLIHLVRQSPKLTEYLPKICNNLSAPVSSSPTNGPGLALSVLTTVFNILPADDDTRFHVFLAILKVVKSTNSFESLKSQLRNLDSWLAQWEADEEDQRTLYLAVADVAENAGEEEFSYTYLLRALRTYNSNETSDNEAKTQSLRALKSSLMHPTHFDFQDLTSLDSIQALRQSEPVFFELLEIFNSELLDDYNDFKDEHDGWIEEQGLDDAVLHRKMQLLTLASLAASTPSRSLPYAQIAKHLKIAPEDVEMWVIDVIRAGLVEGKLSQKNPDPARNQMFLIHRSTYRVFGENQWREVASRLDTWRESLMGVLEVVRREREQVIDQKLLELREAEGRVNGAGRGGGMGRGRPDIDVGAD